MIRHTFYALLLVATMAISCDVAAAPSASVPLDSDVYRSLDKLAGLGLNRTALLSTRPLSRGEAARQVLEAQRQADRDGAGPLAQSLLERLQAEFRREIDELESGARPGSYLVPLRRIRAAYLYRGSEETFHLNTDAFGDQVRVNDSGRRYGEGHNGYALIETEARLGRYLLVNWQPELTWRDGDDPDAGTLYGNIIVGLGPVSLSAGRESLWWGPGRRGTLALTANTLPLDMVRLTNPAPLVLPWFLRYLGPFRFDLFASRLEKDRAVPEPYFSGLRLDMKPAPWLELGLTRTALFGGETRPAVDTDVLLTVLSGHNLSHDSDCSNQIAVLDGRLQLDALAGLQLYGEWGGEDEAGLFISKTAFLVGLFLPKLLPNGQGDLRVEYADVTNSFNPPPVWYRHGVYRSGYVFRNRVMGHPSGGDSREAWARSNWDITPNAVLGVELTASRIGDSQPEPEQHYLLRTELDWFVSQTLLLNIDAAVDRVRNFNYIANNDRTFQSVAISLESRFR